jgi:hypothetical protein
MQIFLQLYLIIFQLYLRMRKLAITFIVTLILFSILLNKCERIERNTVTISDTTWVTTIKDTIIYRQVNKDTVIYTFEDVKVSAPVRHGVDSLRSYSGLFTVDYGHIYYTANVSGYFENISFSSRLNVPERERVINRIGTVTRTIEIDRSKRTSLDLGINIMIAPDFVDVSPSIGFRANKIRYTYSYGMINNSHQLGVSFVVW